MRDASQRHTEYVDDARYQKSQRQPHRGNQPNDNPIDISAMHVNDPALPRVCRAVQGRTKSKTVRTEKRADHAAHALGEGEREIGSLGGEVKSRDAAADAATDQADRALRNAVVSGQCRIRLRTAANCDDVGIGKLRSTVALAVLMTTLGNHVAVVVSRASQKQMIGVHASRHIAAMAYKIFARGLAVEMFVGPAMRPELLLANAERPIAGRIDSTNPNPATICGKLNAR